MDISPIIMTLDTHVYGTLVSYGTSVMQLLSACGTNQNKVPVLYS